MPPPSSSREAWSEWRAARLCAVTSVPGNLALVSYQPVHEEPTEIEVVPGATARRADGGEGVLVGAAAALGLELDGTPVDGEVHVARVGPGGTPVLRHGRYSMDAFSLDGTDFELRIYDEQAPNLANFDGIDSYGYDGSMVVPGTFTAYAAADTVPWDFTRSVDSGHAKKVPGTITLGIEGTSYDLLTFLDGEDLVLVFADATTGSESYAPGRFLRIPRDRGNAAVVVDFNRAFVPPCGFSDFYSCPVPPPQNRIAAPIRAGEKQALWKTARY